MEYGLLKGHVLLATPNARSDDKCMTYGLKEQEGTCKPEGRIIRLIRIGGVQSPYSSEGFQSPSPSRLVTCKGCQRPCELAIKQRLATVVSSVGTRSKER